MKKSSFLHLLPIPLLLLLLLLLAMTSMCEASAGDRDERYRQCVSQCVVLKCEPDQARGGAMARRYLYRQGFVATVEDEEWAAGWAERLLGWSCDENCRYECAHKNAATRRSGGERPAQYHGKWAFTRVLGVQELFSTVFSVLNAVPHLLFLSHARAPLQPHSSSRLLFHWRSWAAMGLNAWFWSAVFHSRDTAFTEKMDYFSAYLLIVWGLWVAIVRTLDVRGVRSQALVLAALLAWYGCHVGYLSIVRFDYGYNMQVNVATAVLASVFWLAWLSLHRERPYARLYLCAILGVYPMSLLELLDFSPVLGLVDAHALWHLSTVPFCFLTYAAVKADLSFPEESETHKTA
ncbi:MAG: post-GPI attachment to proteins factor 3 [archaeon]|nr:post-GPI attachment to proteins factor 3 [archaeon]